MEEVGKGWSSPSLSVYKGNIRPKDSQYQVGIEADLLQNIRSQLQNPNKEGVNFRLKDAAEQGCGGDTKCSTA